MIRILLLLIGAAVADAAPQLAATTTTFEISGGMSTMLAQAPWSTSVDRYTVHSDAVIRSEGPHVFVINRMFADNVLTLDAHSNYAVRTQFSTGALSNPQDLVLSAPARAYVTRYESAKLWIVQPFSGAKLGEIDLAPYADADGIPEMAQMARVGQRVFVALQRLDRNALFAPTGASALLAFDADGDAFVAEIPLQLQNPQWRLRYAPSLQRLVSVATGVFAVLDGGVELVDPFALVSERVVLHESALGGDILDAVLVAPSLGWVLHADASFNTLLRPFDPRDGSVGAPILSTTGFLLSDLELSDDGRLFVGDRRPTAPGVRVLDALSGAALAGPISLGLPPFDFTLVQTTPLASEPVAGAGLLRAYPQPSTGTVFFELPARTQRALRIVDLRGRVVRELAAMHLDGASLRFRWDGRDAEGRAVASGRYFALGAGAPLPISIVR